MASRLLNLLEEGFPHPKVIQNAEFSFFFFYYIKIHLRLIFV